MNRAKRLLYNFCEKSLPEKLLWISIILMGLWQLIEGQYLLFAVLLLLAVKNNSLKQKRIAVLTIYMTLTVSSLLYSIRCFDHNRVTFVTYMLSAVLYGMATLNVLKGFYQKVFIILAIVLSVIMETLELIPYIIHYRYSFLYVSPLFGNIFFYVALLIFSLKYTFPDGISIFYKKNDLSPEQELINLSYSFELGIISEEKHQEERSKIIAKL